MLSAEPLAPARLALYRAILHRGLMDRVLYGFNKGGPGLSDWKAINPFRERLSIGWTSCRVLRGGTNPVFPKLLEGGVVAGSGSFRMDQRMSFHSISATAADTCSLHLGHRQS